jgi:hypothetical protein
MQEQHKDRLDLWLDQALQQYGEDSPRLGLESRLLANLRAQQERAFIASKWVWILGGPVVAALLIALVWRGEFTSPRQSVTNLSNGISRDGGIQEVETLPPEIPVKRAASKPARAKSVRAVAARWESAPRLERFPSPARLSPEELVLVQYAQRFPEEARVIAKQQENFELQVRQAQLEIEKSFEISTE